MRKKFEEPQISFIAFTANDVITTSAGDNLGGWKTVWDDLFFNVSQGN